MSQEQDPPRLMDELAGDEQLRAALRVVSREVPTPQQLQQLVDGVAQSVGQGAGASVSLAKLSVLKLATVVAIGALVTAGALWSVREKPAKKQRDNTTHAAQQPASSETRGNDETRRTSSLAGGEPSLTDQAKPSASSHLPLAPSVVPLVTEPAPRAPAATSAADGAHDTAGPAVPGSTPRRRATGSARPTTGSRGGSASHPASPQPTRKNSPARDESVSPESETSLIAAAQQALPVDAQRTLALLNRHGQLYPHGQFAEEREVLSLDALAQLKQRAALQRRGRDFLQLYPTSVHAVRVRELLDSTVP